MTGLVLPRENHIDRPELYREGRCAVCVKCLIHKTKNQCDYGGPFVGHDEKKNIAPALDR